MASLKAQAHQALNMQRRKVSRQLKPREMGIHHGKTNYLLVMGVASHMQETTSGGPGTRDSFSNDVNSETRLARDQGTSVLTGEDQSRFAGPIWSGPVQMLMLG